MHIAAFSPSVLTRDEVDDETVENERRVAEATAKEEGKPEAALSRIVEGRVNGYFKENVLLEQPFAKEPKKTVAKVLQESGADAKGFVRFRVGADLPPHHHAAPGCRPLPGADGIPLSGPAASAPRVGGRFRGSIPRQPCDRIW